MAFQITFNHEVDQIIRHLANLPRSSASAKSFWAQLATLVEAISANPIEIGEVKYNHRHVKLRSYLVARNFIAIQYAVSEEFPVVFIEKLSLSGNHPYPAEFDKVIHPKK